MATIYAYAPISKHHTLRGTLNQGTQNINGNYTDTTWVLELIADKGWSFYDISSTITFVIDGVSVLDSYAKRGIDGGTTIKLASGTHRVNHNNDGTKTAPFSIAWYQSTTAYYTPGNMSASGSLILEKIPREAKISRFENTNDEGKLIIELSNPGGFTTNTTLKIGNTIIGTYTNQVNRLFTEAEKTIIYNATKTTNQATMTATVVTKNGDTTIGSHSATAYIQIVNANPIIKPFTLKDINNITLTLTGNNQKYIQGHSIIEFKMIENAIGVKNATIVSYIAINGEQQVPMTNQNNKWIGSITNGTSNLCSVKIIDSRGNFTIGNLNIDMLTFTNILIKNIDIQRRNGYEGISYLVANGTFSDVNFGLKLNKIKTVKYKYRKIGDTNWTDGTTLLTIVSNKNWSLNAQINGDIGALGFNEENSYQVMLIVTDELSSDNNIDTLDAGVSGFIIEKVGGVYRAGIGIEPTSEGLDVKGKLKVNNKTVLYLVQTYKNL